MSKRKAIDAKNDSEGRISHVRFEGNKNFTPLNTAIEMAKRGDVDLVVVTQKKRVQHLRTRPDRQSKNNLDELAEK